MGHIFIFRKKTVEQKKQQKYLTRGSAKHWADEPAVAGQQLAPSAVAVGVLVLEAELLLLGLELDHVDAVVLVRDVAGAVVEAVELGAVHLVRGGVCPSKLWNLSLALLYVF